MVNYRVTIYSDSTLKKLKKKNLVDVIRHLESLVEKSRQDTIDECRNAIKYCMEAKDCVEALDILKER